MIEQILAQGDGAKAHVGELVLAYNGLADIRIGDSVVTRLPILKGVTFFSTGVNRVLVWQVGDSWILGGVLPQEITYAVPEAVLDVTEPGSLPDGWGQLTNTNPAFVLVEEPDVAHTGDRVLKVTHSSPTGEYQFVYTRAYSVTPGAQYRGEAFLKSSVGVGGYSAEIFTFTGKTESRAAFDTALDGYLGYGSDFENTTEWKYAGTDAFTIPADHSWCSVGVRISSPAGAYLPATCYLDDLTIRTA